MNEHTPTTTPSVRPSAPDVAIKSSGKPMRSKIKPVPPRVDIDAMSIPVDDIPNLQILRPDGSVNRPELEPKLSKEQLLKIHRAMVLTRKLDMRMLNMQRQGEMGTFAPGLGQEATQIGQVYPLTDNDWFSPSYRSFGAQMWRGWPIDHLMLLWDGFFEGFAPPAGVNDMPFSIVIGSHLPVAAGIAMAARRCGDDAVVVANFGDGALSQGAVGEAFNFAAVDSAPIVFICENNGYAISTPVQKQSHNQVLALRGLGYDLPSERVDGNDVLAMIHACSEAVQRARDGDGPTLIEAITYRMSVHTTADDPKVYRQDDEVEQWKLRDPIARFETYLKNKGILDDAAIEQIGSECEQQVLDGREAFRTRTKANPREVFDYMYETLPPELEAQRAEYLAKLDRKGVK